MKQFLSALLLLSFLQSEAQLPLPPFGPPDTSFNTQSAFVKDKKYHPNISIATIDPSAGIVIKKGINYHRLGKRELFLDAFYPSKGKANGVAVIIIHGGGWRSGNRTQHHAMAAALAQRGYTCFTPEYRLSTEALFPAALHDIKNAVKYARQQASKYGIDTAKIVLTGFSAGGQLAMLAGCTGDMPLLEDYDNKNGISTRVNAIIDIDGTLSFTHAESSEVKSPDKWGASAWWLGYRPVDNPLLWQVASPLNYATFSPPVLFLNSAVERMHAGRTDFIKIQEQRGVYTAVHTFENSPHSFCLYHPWFDKTIGYMDEFLKKVFK